MIRVSKMYDVLDEMKKIYPYDEEKTEIDIDCNPISLKRDLVEISTVDAETGIAIQMRKKVKEGGANE